MKALGLIFIFTVSLIAQEMQFRNFKWGETTKQEMLKELGGKDFGEYLSGYVDVGNYKDCMYMAIFINGKLATGGYIFSTSIEHSNDNLWIDDFDDITNILIEKYGEPQEKDVIWNRDLYRDDVSKWGLACSIGDVEFKNVWKFDNGIIDLGLSGDNYKHRLNLTYLSNYGFKNIKKNTKGF